MLKVPILIFIILSLASIKMFSQGEIYFSQSINDIDGIRKSSDISYKYKSIAELNSILDTIPDDFIQIAILDEIQGSLKKLPANLFKRSTVRAIYVESSIISNIDKRLSSMPNLAAIEYNIQVLNNLPIKLHKTKNLTLIVVVTGKYSEKTIKQAKKILDKTLTQSNQLSISIGDYYIEKLYIK